MHKVLVVDDDRDLRISLGSALEEFDYEVEQAEDGLKALELLKQKTFDLVLLDVNMPHLSGLEVLREAKKLHPSLIVIILTAYSNIQDAVLAVKDGAYHYLAKPVNFNELKAMIDKALEAHRMVETIALSSPILKLDEQNKFIGHSNEMKKVFLLIDKLCKVETPVLIRGESGTGKELVARAIHYNSERKIHRFVGINCGAIPENLVESELFGHEKGAFTGADQRKIGKFQYAHGGTLFLDEIGDLPLLMQVKLLRVLQEKKFVPIGANKEIESNVRIIAATNKNLDEMIKKGMFREDLYYRLNVLPIYLPALRDRKEDIELLTKHFLEKFNRVYQKNIRRIDPQAMQVILMHSWPGNIRELENVIEHGFIMETQNEISLNSLPEYLKLASEPKAMPAQTVVKSTLYVETKMDSTLDFKNVKEQFEREFIINALKINRGKINKTARETNMPKKTLLRKLEKYQIKAADYY